MAQHVSLEGIAENAWDKNSKTIDKIRRFAEECKNNLPFEWKCISICELGDVLGTYASAMTSAYDYSNGIGFWSGIASGLSYAYKHTMNDAKKHKMNPSFTDAAIAAGTAESGCVAAATGVAYYFGSKYGINFADIVTIKDIAENWMLYGQDLAVRLSALAPALPIGLAAMSAFTFPKKSEAGRLVASKNALHGVAEYLKEGYGVNRHDEIPNKVRVYGENSTLVITEESLPQAHHGDFNPNSYSLYRVITPEAKYSERARKSAEALICSTFNDIGLSNHVHVKNPFAHGHSHKHKAA